ncbi:GNAT family N-acetyltransferase [Photobacterium chitinilyticum]|uniref:GNAT family N-acetyltransferase n=1 Tax=Photobacterium chitinilyticum TaxID=2485123 RepID=UPI003D0E7B2F
MKIDFEITTTRLILRPYKIVDLNDLLDAVKASVTQLSPWLTWCTEDYDQQDAYEWINASRQNWQNDISYEVAIFERHSGLLVGSISLNNVSIPLNSAELGYWIRTASQQQGFATEACQALSNFAFNTLGLTRLEIVTHTGNLASQRTALACKAKFECTARNRIFSPDKVCDGIVFSLIPEDLRPNERVVPTK